MRRPGIGKNWQNIWQDVWTKYVWQEPEFATGSAPVSKNTDLRTVVVAIDPTHHQKVVEYEFSGRRVFYER